MRSQPMEIPKKVDDMTWDELREEFFTDYVTRIPNKRAFDRSVKSQSQIHIELTSLDNALDLFRGKRRDLVLAILARALHEEDAENVFYIRWAQFKALADDVYQAHALMKRINKRLAKSTFT